MPTVTGQAVCGIGRGEPRPLDEGHHLTLSGAEREQAPVPVSLHPGVALSPQADLQNIRMRAGGARNHTSSRATGMGVKPDRPGGAPVAACM